MARREQRRRPVGGVHVEPDPVLAAEAPYRLKVVVQARAGGTGGGDQRHRTQAVCVRALQGRLEAFGHDALELVDLEWDHRPLAETEHGHAALDRVVGRGRREHSQARFLAVAPGLGGGRRPRGEQSREIGQRPPVSQHSPGARAPAHALGHPVDHRRLHRQGGRAHLPDGRRLVGRSVQQVGQRGGHIRSGHLVGHLARMVQAGGVRQQHLKPRLEAPDVKVALTQEALKVERLVHLGRRRRRHGWPLAGLALADIAGQRRHGDRGGALVLARIEALGHA